MSGSGFSTLDLVAIGAFALKAEAERKKQTQQREREIDAELAALKKKITKQR